MLDLDRLSGLAREANAYTKERLPTIGLIWRDSTATSPVDREDAKQHLVLQKTNSVYFKDPSKQKRNAFRTKKEKAALANTDNWTYTKAERYAVLDQQIRAGGAPGLSQAVLAFDLTDPLDVNVSYVADGNGDAICTGKANGWLELVAGRGGRNDVDYIRLLTSFGASQSSRDRALNIALERKKMETAQELFRNDADPNAIGNPEQFLAAIRDQDKLLYTMFLTAPTPLNSFYVNQALVEAVGRDPELVALLIAHGADGMLNDAQALCTAINMGSLEETAMILINPDGDLSTRSLDVAANTACAIADENTKGRFLDMLLSAGANANTSRVHDELLEAVKRHELSLIDLLIEHGTSPDRNDAEGLRLAVTSGQIDLVQVLLRGPVPEASTSRALDEASDLEDPDIYEEIVKALVEKGVSQPSLSRCLSDAVEKGCTSLAPMLIEKGANSDYGNARSIRQALKRNDFGLFGKLLEGSCHPSVLCEVLPDAMKIQPSSERFEIMTRLLDKGVSGKELHIALQMVAGSAQDQTDYGLIETLMRHNASVDHVDKNGNCVCTAAAQQDERALDLLCQGNPSPGTVSNAMGFLPVSFATAEAAEYEQQVGMMTTLLEKGAHGTSVAQMLIKAVRDDHREKALAALVHYHANANYEHGKAIEEALNLPRISALELICTGCNIERDSFAAQLPNALNPQGFSLEKATLLARTTKEYDYRGILDKPLLDEVETNGGRREVIELLLALGASANFQHGRALQHAVGTGNVEVCCFLLDAGVEKSNISLAFPLTSGIVDRPTRYSLMQALLAAGQFSMGQDEALVQAAQEAIQHDLSHVELLLEHQASPDFNGGAAVLQSIQTMNLPLLQRFVRTELNEKTLFNAFTLARKIECTKKERHDMFETLLEVYSSIDEISKALIEVVLSDAHDIKTPCLLLDHGASLEPELGLAMQVVASAGSLELLNIFLGKKPSQNCCDESFHSATHSDLSPEQRNPVYRSLLETGITQDLISAAMLQATLADTIDQTLLNLLIDFHASLDFDAGSAVHGIVARGDLSTLIVLLRGDVSQKETLDRSFSAAMALASPDRLPDRLAIAKALLEKEPGVSLEAVSHHLAQIAKENDHDLLSLMMDYEPDPAYNSGESFISSARAGDAKSVELLTRAQVPSDIVDQAFEQLLVARTIQSKTEGSDGLQTAKILLTLSVAQHLVDRALLDGFDDRIDQLTKDLVELLIPYKPNVSGGDGKLFVDAAKISEVELFRSLASQKPDLNVVIPALIQSFEDEEELISFLEHLDECAQREETTLQNFVIFTALRKFPQGNLLAKHLLNNGCPANSKIDAELGPSIGIETMTVLIWALSRVTPEISEEIIMEILGEGHDAEVSFETTVTRISATLLASGAGKNTVLQRLIDLGVDLSYRDSEEHTALFYASREGHLETAKLLIQAGASGDDGSLHEAAREAQPKIIELLLGEHHRDDFPSAIHAEGRFGRTALEELCLNAKPEGDDWKKRIHESIALLLPAQVANIPKSGGKTMLHLALDNKSSVDVMRELLAFPAVWENINDAIYLYQDDQGYVYSPTKYVELILKTDPEKSQHLVTLLRAKKCKDRFYDHTVNQPEGAIGLPEEIEEAVNKKKRADYEQREELKRRNEAVAHKKAIEAEEHERNQRLLKERHRLLMEQLKEQEEMEKKIARDKQRHAQELARQRQEALTNENRIRLEAVKEEGVRQRANAREKQETELAHRSNLEQIERAAQQSRLAAEQRLITARENASYAEIKRQKELCDYKDSSAKYQADQRARAASYAG